MKAAIDIGTNTALLLVAEIRNNSQKVLHEEQRVPRLGQGVDDSGYLSDIAIDRVIKALNEYRNILDQQFSAVENVYVTATSAVRDADNQTEFLIQVEQETGFEVQVLTGLEEARYTFWGAQSVFNDELLSTHNMVLDIGGGSTELIFGRDGEIRDRYSFDMGCVRFTERYLRDDPPNQRQIRACREAIQQTLNEHKFSISKETALMGVAGTVTSLAFIDKKMETYKSEKLAGHVLPKEKIMEHIDHLKKMTSAELLENYPKVMKGRADIFLAGLFILEQVMERYEFNQLVVSTGGIRHGAISMDRNNS